MGKIDSYLSKGDHERLLKVCEAEGCTPYMLTKMALLDKIHNYKLKGKGAEPSGEVEAPSSPESTPDETAMGVAETVKKLMNK